MPVFRIIPRLILLALYFLLIQRRLAALRGKLVTAKSYLKNPPIVS
jgi:hypothetical protein